MKKFCPTIRRQDLILRSLQKFQSVLTKYRSRSDRERRKSGGFVFKID